MKLADIQSYLQMFLVERRMLVVALGLFITSLIIGGAAIWPMWQQAQTTRSKIQKLEQQVGKNQKRLNILTSLTEAQKQDFARVATALPEYKQPLNYLLMMNEIASRSGIVISEYNLDPGIVSTDSAETAGTPRSNASGATPFSFDVTIQGSLEEVERAFQNIETSLPLMEISRFDFATMSKGATLNETGTRYEVILTLVTRYALLDAKSVAKQTVEPLTPDQQAVLQAISSFHMPGEGTQIPPVQYDNRAIFGQ